VPDGPRDKPEPGPSACCEDVTTLSLVKRLESQPERRGRCRRRRKERPRSVVSPCRVDGDVRLTGIRVRRFATTGKKPGRDRPPSPFEA